MPLLFDRLVPWLLLLMPALAMAPQAPKAASSQEPFQRPERIGLLPAKVIDECSGLARSRRHAGILWTHNDSGADPVLLAVRFDGTVVRRVALPTTTNVDWEDIALDAADRLVVADIGDNIAARRDLVLYRLPEPDPATTDLPGRVETFRFRYPKAIDAVNAEALFVSGEVAFIVTKEPRVARLLRLSLATQSTSNGAAVATPAVAATATAELVGTVEGVQHITGACLSADGCHLALLTYLKVVVFDLDQPLQSDQPGPALLATLHKATRRQQELFLGQSEAITFDGACLIIGTELGRLRSRPSLWRLTPK